MTRKRSQTVPPVSAPSTKLLPYRPPEGDEPLDEIEQALVRALVPLIAAKILEEEAAGGGAPGGARSGQGAKGGQRRGPGSKRAHGAP